LNFSKEFLQSNKPHRLFVLEACAAFPFLVQPFFSFLSPYRLYNIAQTRCVQPFPPQRIRAILASDAQ
jgi:hypothetical protein